MRHLTRHLLIALILFAGLAGWSSAMAAEIHGRSSTQYIWYTDIFTEKKQAELGEYLSLSVTKLDADNKISIQGYGRGTYSLKDAGDGSDDLKGRLYYLYLNYRGLFNMVDFQVGRQFVNYAAGSALIDGAQVELTKLGPIGISAMAGRNVVFDLLGERSTSEDRVYAVAAYLQGIKGTDAEISYFVKEDKDGTARDQIGGSFKQYLFSSVKVYGNARYDLASETLSEDLIGIKYYPRTELVFTGEHYESYPTFDNTSIYSVFAVNHFKENLIRADYTITEQVTVNGGYNKQDFEGETANVFEIGVRYRPVEKLQLTLDYDKRSGYGGKLNGFIVEAFYDHSEKVQLALGIHHDVYERDRSTGEETAKKYWVGGTYKVDKHMSTSVRIEDDVNARYNKDWQGRLVLNYDF